MPYSYSFLVNDGKTRLYANYDSNLGLVQYDVFVAQNSYVAIGYGTSMTNTDMVYWANNGSSSVQEDMYSTTNKTPSFDAVNSYQTTF